MNYSKTFGKVVDSITKPTSKNNMENGKLFIGLLAGLAAGLAIGLLVAPASGAATRKNISGTATDWGNSLKKRFQKLTGTAVDEDDPWSQHNRAVTAPITVSNTTVS